MQSKLVFKTTTDVAGGPTGENVGIVVTDYIHAPLWTQLKSKNVKVAMHVCFKISGGVELLCGKRIGWRNPSQTLNYMENRNIKQSYVSLCSLCLIRESHFEVVNRILKT